MSQLQNQAAALQAQIDEARRQAEAEAARRRAADEAARDAISASGFQWPEAGRNVTQEWGPTSFVLEPSYTYHGVYYAAFPRRDRHGEWLRYPDHGGQGGRRGGLGAATPTVRHRLRSRGPARGWDPDLVLAHAAASRRLARPDRARRDVVGYEGSTGNSTGCHLHFATNLNGVWENPRNWLP